jgi:hypothetical protein
MGKDFSSGVQCRGLTWFTGSSSTLSCHSDLSRSADVGTAVSIPTEARFAGRRLRDRIIGPAAALAVISLLGSPQR